MSNLEKAAQVVYESCYGRNLHPGQVSSIVRGLNDAGLLMPDLPEPMLPWDAERSGGTPGSRWYGYEDDGNDDASGMYSPYRYIDVYPGEVWIDGRVLLAPEGAKAYALAILAAANRAEKEQGNE